MTPHLLGATAGALVGLGLVLVWMGLPVRRRPGLEDRLAPYLRDSPRPSRLLAERSRRDDRLLPGILRPLLTDASRRLNGVMGGEADTRKRLRRAGHAPDLDGFRAEQVLWGVAGAAAGAAVGTGLWWRNGGAPLIPAMLLLIGAALGVLGRDRLLSREVARRERRMLAEFPTVAELLALSVSAGEGTVQALERVCRLSSGELASELRSALVDARSGASLATALQGLADRTGLASLTRFVDGVVIALERGTPISDVLRAQAQDVREEGRRSVMEVAGTKEIAMMVPVVFLVLPVTVLFAVYPGFAFLSFSL